MGDCSRRVSSDGSARLCSGRGGSERVKWVGGSAVMSPESQRRLVRVAVHARIRRASTARTSGGVAAQGRGTGCALDRLAALRRPRAAVLPLCLPPVPRACVAYVLWSSQRRVCSRVHVHGPHTAPGEAKEDGGSYDDGALDAASPKRWHTCVMHGRRYAGGDAQRHADEQRGQARGSRRSCLRSLLLRRPLPLAAPRWAWRAGRRCTRTYDHMAWSVACRFSVVDTGRLPPLTGIGDGVLGAIGNTPLVRIASLSDATGCEVTPARPPVVAGAQC